MPTLSPTLKGHNSETVRPFELKFLWKFILASFIRDLQKGLGDQPVDCDRRVEHASFKESMAIATL
jgi:hypothetical protein